MSSVVGSRQHSQLKPSDFPRKKKERKEEREADRPPALGVAPGRRGQEACVVFLSVSWRAGLC